MTRWVLGGLVLFAIFRVLAIGRKAPKTLAEERRDMFGGLTPKYQRTQEPNKWRLRIPRTVRFKRRA